MKAYVIVCLFIVPLTSLFAAGDTETPPRFAVSLDNGYVVAYNLDTVSFSFVVTGKQVSIRDDNGVLFFFDNEYLFQQRNTPLFYILAPAEYQAMRDEEILRGHALWEFNLYNRTFGDVLELGRNSYFDSTGLPYLIWSYAPRSTNTVSAVKSIEYVFCVVRIRDTLCIFEVILAGKNPLVRQEKIQYIKKVIASIHVYEVPVSTGEIRKRYVK